MKNRPDTTLFMLSSVDGKITIGGNDQLDFDKDLPKIKGVADGLFQYYELEQKTDLCSFNTGKVMAKIGVNEKKEVPDEIPVSFVIVDNKPHLKKSGISYLTKWVKKLYLVTNNPKHPAFQFDDCDKLKIIFYDKKIDFENLFIKLREECDVKKMTIQSGGSMNSYLLRHGLIDHLSLVVAPCLVGGTDTPSLIGGDSLESLKDLKNVKSLKLLKCNVLKNSYLHLSYEVIN